MVPKTSVVARDVHGLGVNGCRCRCLSTLAPGPLQALRTQDAAVFCAMTCFVCKFRVGRRDTRMSDVVEFSGSVRGKKVIQGSHAKFSFQANDRGLLRRKTKRYRPNSCTYIEYFRSLDKLNV
jgi:hypothetical protein